MQKILFFIACLLIASAIKLESSTDSLLTAMAVYAPEDCIKQYCSSELNACANDQKCSFAFNDCGNECGQTISCYAPCLAKKGDQPAINLWDCILKNDCLNKLEALKVLTTMSPQQCMHDHCRTEENNCKADRRCVFTIDYCTRQCNKDEKCWKECLDVAKCLNANAYIDCGVKNHCWDNQTESRAKLEKTMTAVALVSPEDCIREHCMNEAISCANDPNCPNALNSCASKCGGDINCWTQCLKDSGNQPAIDYWGCILKYDCLNQLNKAITLANPHDCIQKYCKDEEQACRQDRRCSFTIDYCSRQCHNDTKCWEECLDVAKNANATKFMKCGADHHCWDQGEIHLSTQIVAVNGDPEQCIKEKCPSQWDACQKDSKCIPALQDCQKKCGTSESCWKLCLAGKGDKAADDVAKCGAANHCI